MDTVTIHNGSGATVTDLRYTRAMDWDVPPTEFSEYTTFVGTTTTSTLIRSTDNGFASANPMTAALDGGIVGPINADGTTGPADHGSLFTFGFGNLLDGADYTFNIFYGAGADETDALALLSQVGPELYTLGESNLGGTRRSDLPTFIFAFNGVGGEVVVPPTTGAVPEPASWAMMIAGFGLVGGAMRRRSVTVDFANA
jgi:type IV pilus assembly protein PilY1